MNINERVLGVLSCRYVDEVIMGVPYSVSNQLIEQMKVSVVVEGTVGDRAHHAVKGDAYSVPKELGIHATVESDSTLTTTRLIQRVIEHRMAFEERQKKKIPKDSKVAAASKNNDIQEI